MFDHGQALNASQQIWDRYVLLPEEPPATGSGLPRTSSKRLNNISEETIFYLAYGSNLSAQTFRGDRGIKPLSAVNVHVPGLDLTFDLAGLPYIEPCFANSRYRDTPTAPVQYDDYHKDRWNKGMVGVVYEVTPEDYRIIIATEGGGATYQDVVVDCYAIPAGAKTVDPFPQTTPFNAHTLLLPVENTRRPDPAYAQASARYLKLITDGAEEHSLPDEYLVYLYNIRPYTITTRRQTVGKAVLVVFWLPFLLLFRQIARQFADKDGNLPSWLTSISRLFFTLLWASYDVAYKPLFADGERTMGLDDDEMRVGLMEKRGEISLGVSGS